MPETSEIAVSDDHADRVSDPTFWEEVRAAYLSETATKDPGLAKEVTSVREAMENLKEAKHDRYVVEALLGVGGAGIVFKTWDKSLLTYRALKVARPMDGKEEIIAGLLSEEISRLQEVSHPNIISIFDAGHLQSSGGELPFYTMTFLRGALPAHKYFEIQRPSADLFTFLTGLLGGLSHMHERQLLHLDLKPGNVFVGDGGYAVVADLGGARQVHGALEDRLLITCTTNYAHPELLALTAVSSGGDDNRRRGHIPRKLLKYSFDLYAVGKTIFEIIGIVEANNPRALGTYDRKYLNLQAARLLDGQLSSTYERPLGLTAASLAAGMSRA